MPTVTKAILWLEYKLLFYKTHTTVGTAPGFCTLRALTTWNTSTTPSVLHLSMVVTMAQNIPDLLTVSLWEEVQKYMCDRNYLPFMYLQCTMMGLLSFLVWMSVIIFITLVMVLWLGHLSSGLQLVMCSCTTS